MKRELALVMMGIILVLAGCQQQEEPGTGTFTSGSSGISIAFVDLSPPKTLDEGGVFPVKVILKNKGEYDLTSGEARARLFGVNLDNFGLVKQYKSTLSPLRGMGEFNPEGGQGEIDFGNAQYALPVINSEEFTLRARVCYPYQTRVLSNVCIANAVGKGSTACSVEGEKIKKGDVSGGPIQVTSLKQQTRGSTQVRFDVMIENKGGGEVFNPAVGCEELDEEVFKLSNQHKVKVEVVNPLNVVCDFKDAEPSTSGIVELKNGKAGLSCWMEVNDEPYTERLSLKISYLYRDDTLTTFRIFEKN